MYLKYVFNKYIQGWKIINRSETSLVQFFSNSSSEKIKEGLFYLNDASMKMKLFDNLEPDIVSLDVVGYIEFHSNFHGTMHVSDTSTRSFPHPQSGRRFGW